MSNTTSALASATHASDQHNQMQAKQELLSMLLEGKLSGEKEGWLSSKEAKIILRIKK